MCLCSNRKSLGAHQTGVAHELYGVAKAVQAADDDPFAGKWTAVPETVGIIMLYRGFTKPPCFLEAAQEHPTLPAVAIAFVVAISELFGGVQQFQTFSYAAVQKCILRLPILRNCCHGGRHVDEYLARSGVIARCYASKVL